MKLEIYPLKILAFNLYVPPLQHWPWIQMNQSSTLRCSFWFSFLKLDQALTKHACDAQRQVTGFVALMVVERRTIQFSPETLWSAHVDNTFSKWKMNVEACQLDYQKGFSLFLSRNNSQSFIFGTIFLKALLFCTRAPHL